MKEEKNYDVIIIGKGILGLSTAFRLVSEQKNISIAVVAPDSFEEHGEGSQASGAMLGCFGEVTEFGMSTKEGKLKHNLAYKASKMWPDWIDEINNSEKNEDDLLINSGTFVISNSKSGVIEDDNISAIEASLKEYNEKYESLDFRDIPGFQPEHDSRPIKSLYLPTENFIDSHLVLAKLESILKKSNLVDFYNDLVVSIESNNNNQVVCNTISLRGDSIILAAGSSSGDIISKSDCLNNENQRIFSGTGTSLILNGNNSEIQNVIRTPNRSFSCGLHILPLSNTNLYVGATNVINKKNQTSPTLSDTYFLIECLLEQVDHRLESNNITGTRTGNRSISSDTFPLVGETNIKGVYFLTGAYRDGFHMSPLYSKYIVDLIFDRKEACNNWAFSPQRKFINTLTKEEAVLQTIKYYIAVAYEHNIKTPKVGWVSMFEEMITEKVNSLYDNLTSQIIMPPDFFSLVDLNREEMIPYFNEYYESIEKKYENI